jgi:site-specific DNA-methyltransferase (adenine-specific)
MVGLSLQKHPNKEVAPMVQVMQGDCCALLPTIGEKARLIFADPPYNQGVKYGNGFNDRLPPAVYRQWCRTWLEAIHRELADDGSLWLLVNHRWSWRQCSDAVDFAGFHWRQTITWYETFGVNCKTKFNLTSRPLLWLVKDKDRFVFNDCPEIRRKSDRQTKYRDKRANPRGKLLDDIWTIPRVCGTFKERIPGFPTQLPLALLRRVIACASDPGDLVIDPFSGSGTTGVVCIEYGRRFVGIEQDPEFAWLSRQRLVVCFPPALPRSPEHRFCARA